MKNDNHQQQRHSLGNIFPSSRRQDHIFFIEVALLLKVHICTYFARWFILSMFQIEMSRQFQILITYIVI